MNVPFFVLVTDWGETIWCVWGAGSQFPPLILSNNVRVEELEFFTPLFLDIAQKVPVYK